MHRQIITINTLMAIAYVAGFVKLWLVARFFGVGADFDGYNLALVLPSLISGTVLGVLQTGLFPVRARLAATLHIDNVERFERAVLFGLAAVGLLIALFLLQSLPTVVAMVGRGSEPAVREAMLRVLPYALFLVPLTALADGLGCLLAFRGHYPWVAAASIANVLLGAALLALWPEGGLFNLALGTPLGMALQVGICVWALGRNGFRLVGPVARMAETAREWGEMLRLGGWILPGVFFTNLTIALPTILMASHGEGAVSSFGYAWRLHTYTINLLVMAASPVILARFSELVAQNDLDTVRRILRRALAASVLLGLASVLGVKLLGVPILTIIFSGRFDLAAAEAVAAHWRWLACALGPALLGVVFTKLWQAQGRPRLLSALAALGLFVFWTVAKITETTLGPHAVAVAVAASAFAVIIAGWRAAWKPSTPPPAERKTTTQGGK